MQPVTFSTEINSTLGALGFSYLQADFNGAVTRQTLLFLRDQDGWSKACVIAPAETLREVIY